MVVNGGVNIIELGGCNYVRMFTSIHYGWSRWSFVIYGVGWRWPCRRITIGVSIGVSGCSGVVSRGMSEWWGVDTCIR